MFRYQTYLIILVLSGCGLKKPSQAPVRLSVDVSYGGQHSAENSAQLEAGFSLKPVVMSLRLDVPGRQIPVFADQITGGSELELEVPVGELQTSVFFLGIPVPAGTTFEQMCASKDNDGPSNGTQSNAGPNSSGAPNNQSPNSSQNGAQQNNSTGGGGGDKPNFLFVTAASNLQTVTKDTSVLQINLPPLVRKNFVNTAMRIQKNGSPVSDATAFLLDPIAGKRIIEPCSKKQIQLGSGGGSEFIFDEVPAVPLNKVEIVSGGVSRVFDLVVSETDTLKNMYVLDIGTGLRDLQTENDFDKDGVSNAQEVEANTDPFAGPVSVTLAQTASGIMATSSNSQYNKFFCRPDNSTQFSMCGYSEGGPTQLSLGGPICSSGTLYVYAAKTVDKGPNQNPQVLFASPTTSLAVTVSAGASCSGGSAGNGGGSSAGNGGGSSAGNGGGSNPGVNPYNFQWANLSVDGASMCRLDLVANQPAGVSLNSGTLTLSSTNYSGSFSTQPYGRVLQIPSIPESALMAAMGPNTVNISLTDSASATTSTTVPLHIAMKPGFKYAQTPVTQDEFIVNGRALSFDLGACKTEIFEASASSAVANIAVGSKHACAIASDTKVRCWGNNGDFKLGGYVPTPSNSHNPSSPVTQSSTPILALQLVAGAEHTCALVNESGNIVRCWGRNVEHQLGYNYTSGNNGNDASIPVKDPSDNALTDVDAIAAGGNASCAIHNFGSSIYCWGQGYSPSAFGKTVKTAPSGYSFHSLSVDGPRVCYTQGDSGGDSGRVYCAPDAPSATPTFTEVAAFNTNDFGQRAMAVSTTQTYACAITRNRELKCWSWSSVGTPPLGRQIGSDIQTVMNVKTSPTQNLMGVNNISLSPNHACALVFADMPSPTQSVVCWGTGSQGQLGTGSNLPAQYATPVFVGATSSSPSPDANPNLQAVAVTADNTCVIRQDQTTGAGQPICFGGNSFNLVDSTAGLTESKAVIANAVSNNTNSFQWAAKFVSVMRAMISFGP